MKYNNKWFIYNRVLRVCFEKVCLNTIIIEQTQYLQKVNQWMQ